MLRIAAQLIAWFAFLVAAVGFAARFSPVVNHAVLMVSALSPFLMLGAVVTAILVFLVGPRWAAAPAVILTAVAIFTQLPLYTAVSRPDGPALRVLTVNLHESSADARAVVDLARDRSDLLVVQELSREFADQLGQLGLESEFPHRAIAPGRGGNGVGIWSRQPIFRSSRVPGYELGLIKAIVHVPGAAADAVVLAVHLVGPWPQSVEGWRSEIAALADTLRETADVAGDSTVIVAGDFNATMDMAPFRALLRDGFRDAVEQAGAGFTPTFSTDGVLPPLVGIDHILTRNGPTVDADTVAIPGSDHLGLVATVHPPA